MATTPEIEAQILRYYHAERWRVGTIATQLQLHRDTVARVLCQAGLPLMGPVRRASGIDPYLPFIRETLEQFPTLTASRLYGMVQSRGYIGRPDHFRHLIARHRPRRRTEAYLRLRTRATGPRSVGRRWLAAPALPPAERPPWWLSDDSCEKADFPYGTMRGHR